MRDNIYYYCLHDMHIKVKFLVIPQYINGSTILRIDETTSDDDRRIGRLFNCDNNARLLHILSEQPFESGCYISDKQKIPKTTVNHRLVWQLN